MNFLNGNKSLVGIAVIALSFVYDKLGISGSADADITTISTALGGILAVVGLVHKVIKGVRAKKAAAVTTPSK